MPRGAGQTKHTKKQRQQYTAQLNPTKQTNKTHKTKKKTGKQTDVAYQEVTDVRVAPRLLGAYGDMVVVLRNGDKVEIRSLERYQELKDYILARRDELTGRKRSEAAAGAGRPSIMDLDADDAAVGLSSGGKKGKGFSS